MERIRRQPIAVSGERWKLRGNVSGRIAWEGRRLWHRLGWSVIVALICFSLTPVAIWQTFLLSVRQQSLAQRLQAMQTAVAEKPSNAAPQQDHVRQVEAFYAYLPQHDAIPDLLKQLINVAEKSGVTLSQAEYKAQPELNADFMRYQIVLPVKAAYPSLQTFMVNALQALPTLTLESVLFKRDKIEATDVEAKIHFVLLVKKPAIKARAR